MKTRIGAADLRRLRRRLGYSRQEAATAVGVSAVSWWKWETGRASPTRTSSVDALEALFASAGVPIGEEQDPCESDR
jgi:transcriptional regulator with XRE-family HTH domain